jgi:hypothetical protein
VQHVALASERKFLLLFSKRSAFVLFCKKEPKNFFSLSPNKRAST